MLREGFLQGVNQRFLRDSRTVLPISVIAHAGFSSGQPLGVSALDPNPQYFTRSADLSSCAQRATHPALSPFNFGYCSPKIERLLDGSRSKIGHTEMSRPIGNLRAAADDSSFAPIGLGYSQIEAVTIDERGDDAAIDDILWSAARVRRGGTGAHGFVPVPAALDLQAFLIVRTATVAVRNRTQVLKRFFTRLVGARLSHWFAKGQVLAACAFPFFRLGSFTPVRTKSSMSLRVMMPTNFPFSTTGNDPIR